MTITIISSCKLASFNRTKRSLSRFAKQIGPRTWQSKFTQDGLKELVEELRRKATKNTSIAIFRVVSRSLSELVYSIGKLSNTQDGRYPMSEKKATYSNKLDSAQKLIGLASEAAALVHDIGKANLYFQKKIVGLCTNPTDPIRHEWLSFCILSLMLKENLSWTESWAKLRSLPVSELANLKVSGKNYPKDLNLNTTLDSILFLVASHHRLFLSEPEESGKKRRAGYSLSTNGFVDISRELDIKENLTEIDDPRVIQCICKFSKKLKKVQDLAPSFKNIQNRALAFYSRIYLIMADHIVSSKKYPLNNKEDVKSKLPFANTKQDLKGNRHLDQPLHWHLAEVASLSANLPFKLEALSKDQAEISSNSVDRIETLAPSGSRFSWQDQLVSHIKHLVDQPTLVINLAGTGAGKTIGNVKAALACRKSGSKRFTLGLNLRTLTLQSGDSLREDLGLSEEELSVLIGDRATLALNNSTVKEDEDGNSLEAAISASGVIRPVPQFLESIYKDSSDKIVLGTPFLVSTLDYIVDAGDPTKQGRQYKAALRLMNSDLIVDEVDSIGADGIIAICRMIELSAAFGRHVVVSSASLSEVLIASLKDAYLSGLSLWGQLRGLKTKGHLVIGHDKAAPMSHIITEDNSEDIHVFISKAIRQSQAHLQTEAPKKLAKIASFGSCDPAKSLVQVWYQVALSSINELHDDNHFVTSCGTRLSIGLVRMANIHQIRQFCEVLDSQQDSSILFFSYHANDLLINRDYKEKLLKQLLTRKSIEESEKLIESHRLIKPRLNGQTDLKIVVVASPVEEVGQDHDFDWAVIDPSSAGSCVQTAGRVNRHRLLNVNKPNVHVMNFNYKLCDQLTKGGISLEDIKKNQSLLKQEDIFYRPGPEPFYDGATEAEKFSGKYKKMASTFLVPGFAKATDIFALDSRLRLGADKCLLAKAEDCKLTQIIERQFSQAKGAFNKAEQETLNADLYSEFQLRAKDPGRVNYPIYYDGFDKEFKLICNTDSGYKEQFLPSKIAECSKGFLTQTLDELHKKAFELSSSDKALYKSLMGFRLKLPISQVLSSIEFDPVLGIKANPV